MTSKKPWHRGQRNILALIGLIDPDGVTVAERAATAILTRQADRIAFRSSEPKASASAVAQSKPSPV
jgi:hypothetical protein